MFIKVAIDELHFGSASSIQQESFFSYSLKQGQSSYKCTYLIKITKMTVVFQSGGSVTIDDHQGMFALHYACQGGGLQCVQILMHFGAALNPKNKVRWKFDLSSTVNSLLFGTLFNNCNFYGLRWPMFYEDTDRAGSNSCPNFMK